VRGATPAAAVWAGVLHESSTTARYDGGMPRDHRRSTTSRIRAAWGAPALALVLALTACGPGDDEAPEPVPTAEPTIGVTGTGGTVPTLDFQTPLTLSDPVEEVVWEGAGDPLVDGGPVLLRVYTVSGTDGSVVRDDFASVPAAYLMTPDSIGSELYTVLEGHSVGARIMYAAATDGTPLVSTIDILPTSASGDISDPEAGLPSVEHGEGGVPTVTIPEGTEPPAEPVVRQIIRGTGGQVASGQQVVIQFVAVKWSTGEVFDTTWGEGRLPQTVTLGTDQLIEGFDEGLVDLPVGSEVMLVVPPGLAFGPSGNELASETLVYVVDILAVSPPA